MSERDIIVIERSRPGRDSVPAPPDWATTKAGVVALQAEMANLSLDNLSDVDTTGASVGDVPVYDGTTWKPDTIPTGITVMDDGGGGDTRPGVTTLVAWRGINITAPSSSDPSVAYMDVNYGGTGAAWTAARSDHTHSLIPPHHVPIEPGGYMSSGTRTLATTSVTPPNGVPCIVKAKVKLQMRGADVGAGYYQLRLAINGNVSTMPGGTSGWWTVQGVPDKPEWEHEIPITGTGAAINVTASCIYHSGAGFYTDFGRLTVEIDTAR